MKILLFFCLLAFFSLEITKTLAANACSSYSSSTCDNDKFCIYDSTNSRCECNNTMNADIIFVIDKTTSSFNSTDWGNIKTFLNHTIQYGSPRGTTRYGIITYNTTASSTVLSLSASAGLSSAPSYVNNMKQQSSGTTADLGAAISAAITQFSTYSSSSKKKVLIIIAGGAVTGSPCQYNPRDYDIFTYVIALKTNWTRKSVECLAMSDNNYEGYISSISATSSLSSIYQTIELYTCPHQPDIRIVEVQPINASTPRFVEFYNFGQAFTNLNLSFSGLFKGYASSINVTQGQYLVLFEANDASYPNCSSCSCSKLAGNSKSYWCANAAYIGCGTVAGQSFETIKTTCSAQKTYSSATAWQIQVSYSGTKLDNATYKSDSYWPSVTTNYTYEKRGKLYNSNYGSSWTQSCYRYGTPGQFALSTCSVACSTSVCDVSGGGSCVSSACSCNSGYYFANMTCNPFPPPSNCSSLVVSSSSDTFTYNLARWDGIHYYSISYCTAGTSSCTATASRSTYGPITITGITTGSTPTINTQYVIGSSIDSSSSVSCTKTTSSPTHQPTPSPTHSVPKIPNCNITLNGGLSTYVAYWSKPTYLTGAPNSSSLTGYTIYENSVSKYTSSTPNVLNYSGSWQSGKYVVGTSTVSVSATWSVTDITSSRELSAATTCTAYTAVPTGHPTTIPTGYPTHVPTTFPTAHPTGGPTYANLSLTRCTVTYNTTSTAIVNWTLPTFLSTTVNSSQAVYTLQWVSQGATQSETWQGSPPRLLDFGSYIPTNLTEKMYMFVSWDVNGNSGQGRSQKCIVKTPSPTRTPTSIPTSLPTGIPTTFPTSVPTHVPTYAPTLCPTYYQEKLTSCHVSINQGDSSANYTFPLINILSTTPNSSFILYTFIINGQYADSISQKYANLLADPTQAYKVVTIPNNYFQHSSTFFQMNLTYENPGCHHAYTDGPVSCSVTTLAPTPSPSPAPTFSPTLAPTYGAVTVSFAESDLNYCTKLSCKNSSDIPILLVDEGQTYSFYVKKNFPIYDHNISVVYNFSFVNRSFANESGFTSNVASYLHTFNSTNITSVVDWKIPNNSYWDLNLSKVNVWEGPTYSDLGSWSGTFTVDSDQQYGFVGVEIIEESYAHLVRDYNGEVFLLTLTSCSIDTNGKSTRDNLSCSIIYPSRIFVIVKDENKYTIPVTKTTANKSYMSWFWYVIAAIALLLAVIGYFVYKWWVNKKMAEAQVTDVQHDIDAVIQEQEKGFGGDLGKDNVTFNPLAQPLSHLQKPANNDWTTNSRSGNTELQEKAEVRVEKFNVKQEFGPQTVARRGDRI